MKSKDPEDYARMEGYEEGRKVGIKEVVEFVNEHLHESPACSYKLCFSRRAWQAKKKEWGMT